MTSILRSEDAKLLCERLVHEEMKHKYKLEILYDDLFYQQNRGAIYLEEERQGVKKGSGNLSG